MSYTFAKGETSPHIPGYFVAVAGTYGAYDLVPCALTPDGEGVAAFLAAYIATGSA